MMRNALILSILLTAVLPASTVEPQEKTDCKSCSEEYHHLKVATKEIYKKKENNTYIISKYKLLNTTTSRPELLY